MKATTCQMSNVCCAMCNVVVKAPNDLLTRRPNPQWENDFVILSLGQWVLGQVHWTSHNRHSTFDNCGRGRLLNFRLRPFDDDEADIVNRFCKIQDVCLDTFEDLPRSL